MKIQNVIVHVIQAPLGGENDQFCFSQGWVTCRSSVIVEVITQDGESGFGECMCHGQQPPQIAAAFIENCYKPILLGRDIYDVEVLWEECYNRSRPFGQQGAAINALSGVDIAIWASRSARLSAATFVTGFALMQPAFIAGKTVSILRTLFARQRGILPRALRV